MTEESYQQARKLMQQLNYLRGLITKQKKAVASWTNIEDVHRRNLKHAQAEGAKKQIQFAIDKLQKLRQMFAAIQFPDSNLPTPKQEVNYCRICQTVIEKNKGYCITCLDNQNLPKYDYIYRKSKELPE